MRKPEPAEDRLRRYVHSDSQHSPLVSATAHTDTWGKTIKKVDGFSPSYKLIRS